MNIETHERVSGSDGRLPSDHKPTKKSEPKTKLVFGGTSFANYHFNRSENETSDQHSSLSKQHQHAPIRDKGSDNILDASDAKIIPRRGSPRSEKTDTIKTDSKKSKKKAVKAQGSLESEMYPAMLDSHRPREEWNISQVPHIDSHEAGQEEPGIDQKPGSGPQKIVLTTNEEDFTALNNLLIDHMPATEQDEHAEQEIVFANRAPAASPQFHPA